MFKISASKFGTVSIRRRFHAYAYEFLTTVTEGVVHVVCKVVTRLPLIVIWQQVEVHECFATVTQGRM